MEKKNVASETRSFKTTFETRADENENPMISGYFVVFDDVYNFAPDMSESIDRHAFDNTLDGDIRALFDHDTSKVLGRTTNGTLHLRLDDHGLWGDILINTKDTEAMNLYERIKRGDVNQCSFGFDILDQQPIARDDGGTHWTVKKVKLWEVSPVTFPAYESTCVSARSKQVEDIKKEKQEAWKTQMRKRLKKGDENGIKSSND